MIAAILASLALVSPTETAPRPAPLEAQAACRLIQADPAPVGDYTLRGAYFADGMHGSSLEVTGCDTTLAPEADEAFDARISAYHNAFAARCGAILRGDSMRGAFTGHFKRRMAQLYGMPARAMVTIFVITSVETTDEDPAGPITCHK